MKIASTVRRYTQPRIDPEKKIDTSGDSSELRPGPSVIAGGLQGYVLGKSSGTWLDGLSTGIGGVVGSYAGGKVAKKSNMALGALTGLGVGAATTTAVSAGIVALSGTSFNPAVMVLTAAGGGLAGLAGTLASTKGGSGLMSGGLQGFAGNRLVGLPGMPSMAAGSVGGYFGLEVGKRTKSAGLAVSVGSLAGAAIGAGTTAAVVLGLGGEMSGAMLAGSSLLGGFAGGLATVSSSQRSAPRDGAYGGMLGGMAAGQIVGNPVLGLATAAESGFAARAETNIGKTILGVTGGALTGALAGSLQGPTGILTGAVAGAVAAPIGAVAGTTARQVLRNVTEDVTKGVNTKWVDPYLDKHKLSHKQKLAVGAAAFGVIGAGAGFPLEGVPGALVLGSVGAVAGVAFSHKAIGQAKAFNAAKAKLPEFSRPPEVFGRVIFEQKKISAALKA